MSRRITTRLLSSMFVGLFITALSIMNAEAQVINFPGGRIALSNDGNQHDPDDIVALPMALAMIEAAGLKDKVVHIEHSNHVCQNNPNMNRRMIESGYGAILLFGYHDSILFDYMSQGKRATENFARVINESSTESPLWILAAGPMETVWRALNSADKDKLKHVTVISHSRWNQNHGDCGDSISHKWINLVEDFAGDGVFFVECCGPGQVPCTPEELNDPRFLADQNNSNGDDDFNTPHDKWYWLRDAADPRLRWLYSRNPFNNKFDPSDAGMAYFLITGGPFKGGNKTAGWRETKELLLNPVVKK